MQTLGWSTPENGTFFKALSVRRHRSTVALFIRQMIQPPPCRSISPVRLLQIPFRYGPSTDYGDEGTEIDIFGTINAPGTYGYPNASFTVTPLDTGIALRHLNQTGDVTTVQDMLIATSHLEFFSSGNLPLGNHTMTMAAERTNQRRGNAGRGPWWVA
jgi:hypothetical protein